MGADVRVLWAKSEPRKSLWAHLREAAAVSSALGNPLAQDGLSDELVAWLVGMHDVGKATANFQHKEFGAELLDAGFPTGTARAGAEFRHEAYSLQHLKLALNAEGLDCTTTETLAHAVAWHHGLWHFETGEETAPLAYENARRELDRALRQEVGLSSFELPDQIDHSRVGMLLAGHVVVCDWIASAVESFLGMESASWGDLVERARGLVIEMGLAHVRSEGAPHLIVSGFTALRPLQAVLLERPREPGLTIIEAPTGEGKTEAAWIQVEAWRKEGAASGCFMALPTRSASDHQFERYDERVIGLAHPEERTRLVHGHAWLSAATKLTETSHSPEGASETQRWFDSTRKALLAQHGVGTVDQAMLAAMHVRFGFLRLFALSGKALVIDEVHAYDAYMAAILGALLRWCAHLSIPVLMLSATLTQRQRQKYLDAYGADGESASTAYPLMTSVSKGGAPTESPFAHDATRERELWIEPLADALVAGGSQERERRCHALAELGSALAIDNGSCAVIVNTVRTAQEVFRRAQGVAKTLYHARFTGSDRERIAREVEERFGKRAKRDTPHLLVATQVAEQSLDVSFEAMVSELAPADLLLQRAGRLRRHHFGRCGCTLHVALPSSSSELGGTGWVYGSKPLLRTWLAIRDGRTVQVPTEVREFVEIAYSDEATDRELADAVRPADEEWTMKSDGEAYHGENVVIQPPETDWFEPVSNEEASRDDERGKKSAQTRLGVPDGQVIFLTQQEFETWSSKPLSVEELREAMGRVVGVPHYVPVDGLPEFEQGRLRGVRAALPEHDAPIRYDSELGLIWWRAGDSG